MPRLRDWVDPYGVPVRLYGGRWKGAARDLAFAMRTALLLIRHRRRYQVVYFLMQGLQLAVCLPVARLLRKPVVMKISGSGVIPLLEQSATGRRELRWLRRWAARLLILNEGMREEATGRGFSARQLAWMPNPVDASAFKPLGEEERRLIRARWDLPPEAPTVLYTGRLAPEKGLPCLLESFAIATRSHGNAILVLVGDGPMRAQLEAQAATLGLTPRQVRFIGRVKAEEIPAWTGATDIFALTSPAEGFSCSMSEAMAAGMACLASDIPANRQLVRPRETGILVPVGETRAVAAGLVELMGNSGLRARLGRAARAYIEANFTPDQIAERYERLFADVLTEAMGSRHGRPAAAEAGHP
jgi:glycosyltransferase involved in cell wall biosynthesis